MDRSAAIDLIRGLVAIPSLSHDEAGASAWLVSQMQAAGYERACVDDAGNAVGEIGPADATKTVVLLGHIDTVPGDIPVRIEQTTDGDVLYGRGSVDAKGPLAAFVAAAARLGKGWAHESGLRVVVVGAVEEEAATSKGARFIAARFDGRREPIPSACVIGEPSHAHRITLGYKGRLLMDLVARQPMAHTAGPDASVATVVVDLWNWIAAQATAFNAGREKAFDQLSPSLRRFITSTTPAMDDTVDAQIAWRLPIGCDADTLCRDLVAWAAIHIGAAAASESDAVKDSAGRMSGRASAEPMWGRASASARPNPDSTKQAVVLKGPKTTIEFTFRGHEDPWRGDRQNSLVRSFLTAIRSTDPAAQPGFVLKTGTSDMNVVAPIWRCPIVAYGPGDSALDHTPHEHLSLDEYWRAVVVLEGALRTFAESGR